MVRTTFPARLALAVWLMLYLGVIPARGQGPGTDSAKPLPPANGSRPAEASPVVPAAPVPFAVEGEGVLPTLPPPSPADHGEPVEPAPPAQPAAEASPQVPSSGLDAFALPVGLASPFLNPTVGQAPIRANYRATWFPSEPVAGQPTSLGYVQQDFLLSCPIWQYGKTEEWSVSVNVRNELFETHAILPDTHQPFPDDLWGIRLGTTYRHLFDNGWIGGGSLSVGSVSDKPFHSIDEMTVGLSAFLRIPQGEHNAWLFSLSYSPTGELQIPIPGIAYVWQPSDSFHANIGLPFQVMWRPTDELMFDCSYMLLTTVHARATYRLSRPVRLYVLYAWENEAYLLADRLDTNDRFFNVDQRVGAGVQVILSPHSSLDLSSGYVFDRFFFEGRNILNGTNFNRVDVEPGAYLSLQCQVRW